MFPKQRNFFSVATTLYLLPMKNYPPCIKNSGKGPYTLSERIRSHGSERIRSLNKLNKRSHVCGRTAANVCVRSMCTDQRMCSFAFALMRTVNSVPRITLMFHYLRSKGRYSYVLGVHQSGFKPDYLLVLMQENRICSIVLQTS